MGPRTLRCIGNCAAFAALVGFAPTPGDSQTTPQPQITSVVNAATFYPGLPLGGGLATVIVSDLVGVPAGTYQPPNEALPPTQLQGFTVSVNSATAPILAVVVSGSGGTGSAQINFQVPAERNASNYSGSTLIVCVPVPQGCAETTPLPEVSSGGFFADANGYAIAQHASDYSLVTTANPAHPGETIIAYGEDLYLVWPPPPVGFPTPSQPLFQHVAGTYSMGGLYLQAYPFYYCQPSILGGLCGAFVTAPPLQMTFEGLAPGLIGVEQINFVVPGNQQPGTYPLFFNTGCYEGVATYNPDGCATQPTSSAYALLPVG